MAANMGTKISTALALLVLGLQTAVASRVPDAIARPMFLSPHATPIVLHESHVFVANTPADSVDVIDRQTATLIQRIHTGIDPVSLAIRPDGSELWATNHISDSVSVIDINPSSPTYFQVTATVQDIDPVSRATRFDEPVGIAFANNDKAYVALSSENQIAVVDTNTYEVIKHLDIPAQDPRAIAVHGNKLFVLPFESNNQTQLSGCTGPVDGDLCTFDALQHSVLNNNVLSQFTVVDIVRNPRVPDKDLFVFDTESDQLLEVVDTIGTLLYGLAVDATGRVFVTLTEARNDANGRAGTLGDGLAQMENRPFLNQIARIDCTNGCQRPDLLQLEPLPPLHPDPGKALATPYAITISQDNATIVASAASSNIVFTMDANTGQILGRVAVDEVPRGLALESGPSGLPTRAWVLSAAANSVAVIDLADIATPVLQNAVALPDPTDALVKRGRIAFNNAQASTTQTFACESCHPDGHTDQLLWVLNTPMCDLPGCDQIVPRITMPVRGLRDTWPFHWDGIPGDPYGGINSASINASVLPNCDQNIPQSCTRNLVDGSLAGTMCQVGTCPTNQEGKPGALSADDRNAMAEFLLNVPYPPAQRRSFDNQLSVQAQDGFRLFHIDGDLQPQPNVCGDCHRMPFWISTNSPGTGMDAPTWRGAYDRWLILPQGRLNIIDFNFFSPIAQQGLPEQRVWRLTWGGRSRFDPVWNMVTEGSTGHDGAFARQVTLNRDTSQAVDTIELLSALETADENAAVVLQANGVLIEDQMQTPITLQYERGIYFDVGDVDQTFTSEVLQLMASKGQFMGTHTAYLGEAANSPQPAIWAPGPLHAQVGRQRFPIMSSERTMQFSGRHIQAGATLYVDGKRTTGQIRCANGMLPNCVAEVVVVELASLPDPVGMHFLQVQNPRGQMSNDFIFHTQTSSSVVPDYDLSGTWYDVNQPGHGLFVEHLAGDSDRLNIYWYVYQDGAPVWLTGVGNLEDGRVIVDLFITSGGDFATRFESDQVALIPWGSVQMEFPNNHRASMRWKSSIDGFGVNELNLQRLSAVANNPTACSSGSYFNPHQPGQGFAAQVINSGGQDELLLSWYTYLDGNQIWLLGQGPLANGVAEVSMQQFYGADFPPRFEASTVSSQNWGSMRFEFTDENAAEAAWVSEQPGFDSGTMDLARLTTLAGRNCNPDA